MTQQTKTAAEKEVQTALYEFWFAHYTNNLLTIEQRIKMVESFTDQWLDPTKIKVDKPVYNHPMTRIKRRYNDPKSDPLQILADFILRADIVAERRAEYPITHAEQDATNTDNQSETEIGLWFTDELDKDGETRTPNRYMKESDVLERMVEPAKVVEVEQLREELEKAKKRPAHAARLLEKYGKEYSETKRRIKTLDLGRVRKCLECGNGFYAHDLRRHICDMQHGIIGTSTGEYRRSEQSACELQSKRDYHKEYYESSLFKVE